MCNPGAISVTVRNWENTADKDTYGLEFVCMASLKSAVPKPDVKVATATAGALPDASVKGTMDLAGAGT